MSDTANRFATIPTTPPPSWERETPAVPRGPRRSPLAEQSLPSRAAVRAGDGFERVAIRGARPQGWRGYGDPDVAARDVRLR
jgi:hypothetical protein